MFLTSRQTRATLSDKELSLLYDGVNLQLHVRSNEKVLGVNIDENCIFIVIYQTVCFDE